MLFRSELFDDDARAAFVVRHAQRVEVGVGREHEFDFEKGDDPDEDADVCHGSVRRTGDDERQDGTVIYLVYLVQPELAGNAKSAGTSRISWIEVSPALPPCIVAVSA